MLSRLVKAPVRRAAEFVAATLRQEDPSRLFWPMYHPFNFGDWITPFLYRHMTGLEPSHSGWPNSLSRDTTFMGAGSTMDLVRRDTIVWGSGILRRTDKPHRPHAVHAVRGPYSRERLHELGFDCPEIYGDPGILVPLFTPRASGTDARLGIVPHFRDRDGMMEAYADRDWEGVRFIDVRHPVSQVAEAISACEVVVSSSLHGLLIAQSLGIPAGWIRLGGNLRGDGVKFHDHHEALGVSRPERLDDALDQSFDALRDFALGQPRPSVISLVTPLIDACPFPVRPDIVADMKRRIPEAYRPAVA